jgi:RimJ/RimL family protein N-acetyltransferase
VQHRPQGYHLAPEPLIRVGGPNDAAFVSEIAGADAAEAMTRVTTLVSDNGFFFLEPITAHVFEAHMAFRQKGRGKECVDAARAGLRHCFNAMGAVCIFGRIPVEDRAARLLTRLIGFRSEGIRPHHPGGGDVEWFEMLASDCPKERG